MNELEQGNASMSLEESPEIVAPAGTVTPPAQEPVETPPAAQEEPDPEGTVVIPQGKVVPLTALQAERAKRKEADKLLSAKDQEIAAIKEKAQKYDEAAAYLQQAKPYIEKAKADFQRQSAPPEPQGPLTEAEAVEYAKDFDLYTSDGKPDIARAQRIAARHEKLSERKAQQAVSPILQTEAQRQSNALFQHYAQQPEINGVKIDSQVLAQVWQTVPPDMIVQPGVAEVLFNNALAIQIRSGKVAKPAPPPVVPTESLGGGAAAPAPLSDVSQRFMSAAGIQKKTFTELREQFKPGQSNSLES